MVELPTVVHFYFEIFGGAPLLAGALLHFYLHCKPTARHLKAPPIQIVMSNSNLLTAKSRKRYQQIIQ